MYVYNFPATIFVDKNTVQEQINHLAGELEELKKAEGWEEQIDETLDIIHSAETLLRILEGQRDCPGCIGYRKARVIIKNNDRGYYDLKLCKWQEADRP